MAETVIMRETATNRTSDQASRRAGEGYSETRGPGHRRGPVMAAVTVAA
jgi:hypothetical protein